MKISYIHATYFGHIYPNSLHPTLLSGTHTLSCSQFNIYIFVLFWTAPDSSYSFHMNMCIESSTGELANYQRSYCQWEWLSFTSHCLSISLPNTTEFGNPSLIIGTTLLAYFCAVKYSNWVDLSNNQAMSPNHHITTFLPIHQLLYLISSSKAMLAKSWLDKVNMSDSFTVEHKQLLITSYNSLH